MELHTQTDRQTDRPWSFSTLDIALNRKLCQWCTSLHSVDIKHATHNTPGGLTYRMSAYTTHRADSHTVCQRTISINSLSVFTLTYNYQTSRARQSPTYLDVNGQHDLLVLAVVACHPIDRLWNKLQHKVEIDFIFLFTTQTNVSRIHNIALLHSHHFWYIQR